MQIKDSKELFGGISVLVVGDFNQLQPIMENPVYCNSSDNCYKGLVTSSIWSSFKLFEFTEIMRQKDDIEFAEILNKIGNKGIEFCSSEEIDKLNSRIIKNIHEVPRDTIILCHRNLDVENFNRIRIVESEGNLIIHESINIAVGPDSKNAAAQRRVIQCSKKNKLEDTGFLPQKLFLKVNKKYMITTNMNLSDGLCNGTVGILRKIVMEEDSNPEKPRVARIWIELEGTAGKQQRFYNISLNEIDEIPILENWTPITCTAQTIFRPKTGNYRVQRIQFPLIECEAMTIHKCQGQTFPKVAIYINNENNKQSLTQKLMYVALSRCEKLSGLYLFGTKSIRPKQPSETELIKKAAERDAEKGRIEMQRLRKYAALKFKYDFATENYKTQHLTVMFQNVNNIGDYFDKLFSIQNNIGYRHADIIFLVECHTNIKNINYLKIKDDYTLLPGKLLMSHGSNINSSHGQICFVRKSLEERVKFEGRNKQVFKSNDVAELDLYSFSYGDEKTLYLLSAYFHPDLTERGKADALENFLNRQFSYKFDKQEIILFGDFNTDFNKKETKLGKAIDKMGFKPTISNTKTHLKGNQLDWVFTNQASITTITTAFPTWFSDHSALHTKIKLDD